MDVVLVAMANGLNQADRAIMPIAIVPLAQEFEWTHICGRSVVLDKVKFI